MKNEFFLRKLKELEDFGREHKCAVSLVVAIFVVLTFFKNDEATTTVPIANTNIVNISNTGEVKSESISNNEYESYFNNNDWRINGWWQKDEKTLICEPNSITKKDGGPKMTNENYSASNNFRMKVNFTPKSNNDEINFVIYIEGFYRMVLGDGNRKFFYIKQEDNFISETNKDFEGPTELENEIRFDKPVEIEIIQSVLSDTSVMDISVSIRYSPEENHNTESILETYRFQTNDNSFCNNKREITLGLLCEKNIVTAKLNYFYLKNH